jgi:hypothetical protein
VCDKDLGFVLEPAEGAGMDDTVAVTLEDGPGRAFGLGVEPAAAVGRIAGIGSGFGHDPAFNLAVSRPK